ncbi:hypothetical protein BG004_003268, partial [Podila humilis]
MTFETPIQSAIVGTLQRESSNITYDGVSSSGGYNHVLTHTEGLPDSPEHSEPSIINLNTEPAIKHNGGSSHDAHADDSLLTVPAGLKQPPLGAVPAGFILPADRPRSHN